MAKKRKKRPEEMTDEEVMKHLFPKKVRDKVARAVKESNDRADSREKSARKKAKGKKS